jgi:hypothetical protein
MQAIQKGFGSFKAARAKVAATQDSMYAVPETTESAARRTSGAMSPTPATPTAASINRASSVISPVFALDRALSPAPASAPVAAPVSTLERNVSGPAATSHDRSATVTSPVFSISRAMSPDPNAPSSTLERNASVSAVTSQGASFKNEEHISIHVILLASEGVDIEVVQATFDVTVCWS